MAQGNQACLMGLESLHCPSLLEGQVGQVLQLCLGIQGDPVGPESLAGLEIPGRPSHPSSLGVLALLWDPLGLGGPGGLQILGGPALLSLPLTRCSHVPP